MIFEDRCQFCHSSVKYNDEDTEMLCPACGEKLLVVEFKREQLKLRKAEEEAKAYKEKSELAEKAREAAVNTLNTTLGQLERIGSSQEQEEEFVRRVFDGQAAVSIQLDGLEENQQAIRDLVHGLLSGQERIHGKQDTLLDVLTTLMQGQDDTTGKLHVIQDFARRICDAQKAGEECDRTFRKDVHSAFAQLQQDLAAQLKQSRLDADRQVSLLSDFSAWARNVQAEDRARLESIIASTDAISDSQHVISKAITNLAKSMEPFFDRFVTFQENYVKQQHAEILRLHEEAQLAYSRWNFDKAGQNYEAIHIRSMEDDPLEISWYRLLCHFGVTYIDRRPVIFRPDTSPLAWIPEVADLESQLQKHPQEQRIRKRFQEILQQLSDMRKAGLNKVDVFLCADRASRAPALSLKKMLEKRKLRVFCSPGARLMEGTSLCEGDVLSALQQAKVMILVAGDAAELRNNPMHSEWIRYQWQISRKKEDRHLFCALPENQQARLALENDDLDTVLCSPMPLSPSDMDLQRTLGPIFPLKKEDPSDSLDTIFRQVLRQILPEHQMQELLNQNLSANQMVQVLQPKLSPASVLLLLQLLQQKLPASQVLQLIGPLLAGSSPTPSEENPNYEGQLAALASELQAFEQEPLPTRQRDIVSYPHTLSQYNSRIQRIDQIRQELTALEQHLDVSGCKGLALKVRTDTSVGKMKVVNSSKDVWEHTKQYLDAQKTFRVPREAIYIRHVLDILQKQKKNLIQLGISESDPYYQLCESQIRQLERSL